MRHRAQVNPLEALRTVIALSLTFVIATGIFCTVLYPSEVEDDLD